MTYEITFENGTAATDYLTALSFRRLPVRGAQTFAATGRNDDGAPITTFARRHLGDALTFTFTEMPRRA